MNTKRLRFLLFAIPVCLISVLIIGAQRSHPASASGVIDPTCVSSLPCIEYDNNGSGPGIRGVSLTGNGSNGITKVNSTSATNGREGVFGNDMSASGSFNSGVRGLSVRGTGVLGNSTSGAGVVGQTTSGAGVSGLSSSGSGVSGTSTSGHGISGNSSSGPGLSGTSSSGDGVDGSGNTGVNGSGSNIGVLGSSGPGGTGVQGNGGTSGDGVVGQGPSSTNGAGVLGTGYWGVQGLNQSDSSSVAVVAESFGGPLFKGIDANNSVVKFLVDDSGNVTITGKITTSGTCSVGCAKPAAAPGYHVISYAPTESLPTMEDTGEAQLVNGAAYVRIDPAFANVIDKIANYVVLITPEGDSHGLYVTQKSPTSFAVHENQGGRSTLAFGYRIVAKPYGSTAARLPMIYTPKEQTHRPGSLRPSQLHG